MWKGEEVHGRKTFGHLTRLLWRLWGYGYCILPHEIIGALSKVEARLCLNVTFLHFNKKF
jgi:hypothetical protein